MSTSRGRSSTGHRRRRTARRQAVDLLYQADLMGREPLSVLEEWRAAGRAVPDYTVEVVSGVAARLGEIDALIGSSSEGWAVHRMPVIDRTILRVACQELHAGVPAGVAISEAVHLANELSTEDSGRFVNGVLGTIARQAETGPAEGESP